MQYDEFNEAGGEGEEPSAVEGRAFALIARSETEAQVATARRYPRSIRRFLVEAREMACLTEGVAQACMYALPRGNKTIEGPSARFAEIVASAWGNCSAGARTIDEDERFVTAQGVFRDLERNVTVTYEVRRRITDRNGAKFNDDMIGVTANAACSIAFRNAVLKGIPKAFWEPVYDAARAAAVGDVKTLAARRADMVAKFSKMGVTEAMILAHLGREGLEDVGTDDIKYLAGLFTALRDGDASVDVTFGVEAAAPPKAAAAQKPAERAKPEPKGDGKAPAGAKREGGKAAATRGEKKPRPEPKQKAPQPPPQPYDVDGPPWAEPKAEEPKTTSPPAPPTGAGGEDEVKEQLARMAVELDLLSECSSWEEFSDTAARFQEKWHAYAVRLPSAQKARFAAVYEEGMPRVEAALTAKLGPSVVEE